MSKRTLINTVATAICGAVLLLSAGCKGRTMENMEPTGETVEVVIGERANTPSTPAEHASDNTPAAPDASSPSTDEQIAGFTGTADPE